MDEIQTITKEHRVCLQQLHLGNHRLPLVPIYAGLADSRTVLVGAGLSRLQSGNMLTLGALELEECISYVKQMLDRCRISYPSSDMDSVANRIAKKSEGWPQHLHPETAALFGGLGQAACDLQAVDFSAVEKQAADCREMSYQDRQSSAMESAPSLVAAVIAAVPEDGMHKSEIFDIIKQKARSDPSSWCLLKGMDADACQIHLLHQGVLQPNRQCKWVCPIPSLRIWLIDQDPEVHKQIETEMPDRKIKIRCQARGTRRQKPNNENEGR